MKRALISPNEVVTAYDGTTGQRVAEVSSASFEIAEPLFWLDCPDECVADLWFYRGGALEPIPQEPEAA
jgi:hypothetical protein